MNAPTNGHMIPHGSCAADAEIVKELLAKLDAVWDEFAGNAQIVGYERDVYPEDGHPIPELDIVWPLLGRLREFIKAESIAFGAAGECPACLKAYAEMKPKWGGEDVVF